MHEQHGNVGNAHRKTHGYEGTPLYESWSNMKARCSNRNNTKYQDYGGRGITYCERWKKFELFLADMGERPVGMTLDRIDNDKGYCQSNCRWATRMEQARNRRSNVLCFYDGVTKSVTEWAYDGRCCVNRVTLAARIRSGWAVDLAITTPPKPSRWDKK